MQRVLGLEFSKLQAGEFVCLSLRLLLFLSRSCELGCPSAGVNDAGIVRKLQRERWTWLEAGCVLVNLSSPTALAPARAFC